MLPTHVLIVEDDPGISSSLSLSLELEGYTVTLATTLAQAHAMYAAHAFSCILLDLNLPDGSGYDFCDAIRRKDSETPILMLTANVAEASAVRGMQCGADDYIRKPYSIAELCARVRRAVDRRSPAQCVFGGLRANPSTRQAWSADQPLPLGRKEFDILLALMQRKGEVVTRDAILGFCSDSGDMLDRTIDSHLSHLRKKLRVAGSAEQIVPVYGVGYRLVKT